MALKKKETDDAQGEVVNYDEAASFIVEHANKQAVGDPTELLFQVNRDPFRSFMKSKGISADTLKQHADAHNEYLNGSIEAATKIMLDADSDVEKVSIRTRTDTGRIDTVLRKSIATKNPQTGEKGIKYGSVAVTIRSKSQFSSDVLKRCEDSISKKFGTS